MNEGLKELSKLCVEEYGEAATSSPATGSVVDGLEQIVERFLGWEFPRDFSPDGGISFEPPAYPNHPFPTGINLLDYEQAKAMILEVVFNEDLSSFKPNAKNEGLDAPERKL